MSNSEDDIPPDPPRVNSVGNGKPAMIRRFKESGSRKGRPAGARNRKTIIKQVAQEKHQVIEDGRKTLRTTRELVVLRLRNLALEGKNAGAVTEYYKLLSLCEPQTPHDNVGVLVVPAMQSPEEWIENADRANALKREPPP